ncbi:hypothetical protein SUBVAR_06608 [Subdoligranulum variabile DSM 15176]|uniref:Uncharacterized protein n=1 Tax=Subdoligranulum variabile DSM 15176 TaxID=411471 RepID=D1PQE0_9FIRM|nr:hypothetical protein SUBVAR_06608 [Subdoligranulum variabile DSM 15176]
MAKSPFPNSTPIYRVHYSTFCNPCGSELCSFLARKEPKEL